ncbi:DUF4142 domain-containing protein [Hymenobacter endophyticus]|uniref:DUF4142 domain-containing protein n=1 Tax=Hymenobacter endophyticus TaxID=3076335 RepID=A0ABU3TGB8_9BACT|nr:DUF4142 domain-containing protein [Hymenobacter endophyticus]MDU0370427.1 DUF4142 domain-containing protein [Hymenobacter endophyticus]
MKTTHSIFRLFLLGSLATGAACTGTSPGAATDAATTTGTDATGTRSGTDMTSTPPADAASGAGSSGTTTAATSEAAGTTGSATSSTTGAGAGNPADMTAFTATFATMQDPVFLMNAASSNLLEIQLGQAAAQRASNADVKRFAQMMVTHHTKATQDLKSVATPLGVQIPETMMPVHQAMADKVLSKSGKDFDEAYMDAMETAHKMDIAMFEVKSRAANTPTVKTFATNTLPMLRSHEKMASETEKKVD